MAYIEINDLDYIYADREKNTLKQINMKIDEGEFVLIEGESGSGKSTLAKCITGAVPNFYGGTMKGNVLINGNSTKENYILKDIRKEVTMVFQDPERQLFMNVVEKEIAFGLENLGMNTRKMKRRIWETMEFTNILNLAHRKIESLSGGEKQKVAITAALAFNPKCIILDEPTSQLDPNSSEEIINLICKINKELGITVILIEQRVNKWFEKADKIAILKKGELEFYGSPLALYKRENMEEYLPYKLRFMKHMKINDISKSFREIKYNVRKLYNEESFKLKEKNEIKDVKRESIIEVKKLRCSYTKEPVIEDFDLDINKGDFLGILGANGAGKTTLLKSMAGLIDYRGSIKIDKKEVKKLKMNEISKKIGYISQNPNDYISKETVYNELQFTLDNYGIKDKSIIDKVLLELNLSELKDVNPRDLSGGERQRVAIASILVLEPKIFFLDEPTRGIDTKTKESLGNLLKKLNINGTTIAMVTHDVDFACKFCNKFMIMFNGENMDTGTRTEVFSDGIYYNTDIHKLFKGINDDIFTVDEAIDCIKIEEE